MTYRTTDEYYQDFVKDMLALREKYLRDRHLAALHLQELKCGLDGVDKEKDKFSSFTNNREALEDIIKITDIAIDHTMKWSVKDGYERARRLYSAMIKDSLRENFNDEWEVLRYGDEDYDNK